MKKYAVFIEGHRLTSGSLAESLIFVTRRIVFVVTAIFARTPLAVFSAIIIYMLASLLMIVY